MDYILTRWLLLISLVAPAVLYKDINLTIGGIFPMSGPWAGGIACLPAVQLALDDINNNTSILPYHRLNMHSKDSECKPGLGAKVLYELLYNKPTKIMLLSGCSIVSTFVAQAANMWNLIVMGYGASSPALSNRKRFPTFFRTHPSATIHNPTRVKLFQIFKWDRISTIQETQEVFTSTIEDLERRVKMVGISIDVRQSFLTDPKNAVKNLKRQDARIIVGVFYENMARRVFCQAYHEGLYGKKYVWLLIGWYPDNWFTVEDENIDCTPEQMKKALEGHLTTEAIMWSTKSVPNDWGMTTEEFKVRLDEKLNITSGAQVPGYPEAPLAYDAVWAVALSLHKAQKRLYEEGHSLEDFDYLIKATTDEIYSAMNSTEFIGVSDKVRFSSEGDRIALTHVEQLIDGKYKLLARYDYLTDTLEWTDSIHWLDGKVPKDRTVSKDILRVVSQGLFSTMVVLAIMGIFASFGFLLFNILNRHRRCIMLSQPNINNLLLIGCIICLVTIILLGLDGQFVSEDTYPHICMARAWLLAIGFTFGYGALFSKIWTVHRYTTVHKKDRKIDPKQLFAVILVLLAVDIIILSIWTYMDPLERTIEKFALEEPLDDIDVVYKPQLEHCSSQYLSIWLGVCLGYKGILLLFGVFLAYETRSVKLKLVNDTRFIGMSIYNVVVMSVITAPISFIISSQHDASFAFISLAILLCCFVTMSLVFIPKVHQLLHHPDKSSVESRALSDFIANREEEERHERLAAENEHLKVQISEIEDRILELNKKLTSVTCENKPLTLQPPSLGQCYSIPRFIEVQPCMTRDVDVDKPAFGSNTSSNKPDQEQNMLQMYENDQNHSPISSDIVANHRSYSEQIQDSSAVTSPTQSNLVQVTPESASSGDPSDIKLHEPGLSINIYSGASFIST